MEKLKPWAMSPMSGYDDIVIPIKRLRSLPDSMTAFGRSQAFEGKNLMGRSQWLPQTFTQKLRLAPLRFRPKGLLR